MKIKKEHLDFLDWELGAFFHFGIRTFYEGHKDWDLVEMAADVFNPRELDCENWIKAVKAAGAKYAILVCKHHDGFANWPSKYTDYSVASTPWKDGKGDVVEEFCAACRKHDLKIGLYYSPAQFGSKDADKSDYDDYFINQIGELLTNYGKIDYIWFDGCGSEGHEYDTVRIVKEIRRMQPGILIFNMWDPDTRWIGNESGVAGLDEGPKVDSLAFSVLTDEATALNETLFIPAECDFRLRANWFFSENDGWARKSVDELLGLYIYSVGRSANMLLNIGPDRRGLLPREDELRLKEFGDRLKEEFGNPQAEVVNPEMVDGTYTLPVSEESLVKYVIVEEEIAENGGNVTDFQIEIGPKEYGKNKVVYRGFHIAHKAICPLPKLGARHVTLRVNAADGDYKIKKITVI